MMGSERDRAGVNGTGFWTTCGAWTLHRIRSSNRRGQPPRKALVRVAWLKGTLDPAAAAAPAAGQKQRTNSALLAVES